EGIRRATERAQKADIKIAVFDAADMPHADPTTMTMVDEDTLILINNTDTAPDYVLPESLRQSPALFPVSVAKQQGVDAFLNALENHISGLFFSETSPIITHARHRRAIEDAVFHLERFAHGGAIELMGEELRLAMQALAAVTGRIDVD